MKWLTSLIIVTVLFLISGFFVKNSVAFRFMTVGMAAVSFIVYFIIQKNKKGDNNKILGSNLAAVVAKFGLSMLVIVLYAFIYGFHGNLDFIYFLVAYLIYSIITYTGAYYNR